MIPNKLFRDNEIEALICLNAHPETKPREIVEMFDVDHDSAECFVELLNDGQMLSEHIEALKGMEDSAKHNISNIQPSKNPTSAACQSGLVDKILNFLEDKNRFLLQRLKLRYRFR